MDRILKAEGDSPDRYKICKQADVCMLFYLLTPEELLATLKKMGYPFSKDLIRRNIEYYFQRTTHGSTLSLVVYSYILYDFDKEFAWSLYKRFVLSDICDIQKGTTAEGIHLVPLASSLSILIIFIVDPNAILS
jgi:trehalose/maltose hydrolase-like predicted phosphorylase